MSVTIGVTVSSGRLTFAPVAGRRTLFVNAQVGPWHVFISRWDTARVHVRAGQRIIWGGPLMTWYVGATNGRLTAERIAGFQQITITAGK